MNDLIVIDSRYQGNIRVQPRWPYRRVAIAPEALRRIEAAQERLGRDIRLVVTRAFEPGGAFVRLLHRLGRTLGSLLFVMGYPNRLRERPEIFSPNGHDQTGTHVDIAIEHRGEVMKLLPWGVLSSRRQVARSTKRAAVHLDAVYEALRSAGFTIHNNPTEALQIHCDMVLESQSSSIEPCSPKTSETPSGGHQ